MSKDILIPSVLLDFYSNTGVAPSGPSNKRLEMSKELLALILKGNTTIPINKKNSSLINWIQSKANNNTLHMIWYLRDAYKSHPQSSAAGPKIDLWSTKSKLV